ncbi:vesicle transport protein [Pycnococcus provasolii]
MSGMFASLKRSMEKAGYQLGITEEPEPTLLDTVRAEFSEATTMSYTTRFYGFCACFSVGILMSMMSSLFWGNPTKFGVTYTFGNLISICSMMFLFGPKAQIEGMTKSYRVIATLLYVLCMVATLVSALYLRDPLLTLICIIAQSAALTWYCLSYIPYARSIVARCFGSMVNDS